MAAKDDGLTLITDTLFDSETAEFLHKRNIVVNTQNGRISSVHERTSEPNAEKDCIDLRGHVVLPGLSK